MGDKTTWRSRWFNEGGKSISLGNILTILAMLGTIGGVWATLAADNSKRDLKIDQVEKRQEEDRKETKDTVREVKQDVKTIATDVQKILIKLEAAEVRERGRDNERWRRPQ